MAKEKGFYNKYGLDVRLHELSSGHSQDIIKNVLSGEYQFGISDSSLIYKALKGEPVMLLMPVLDHWPIALVSFDPKVKHLKDIEVYKTIFNENSVKNPAIVAMLKARGIDVNKLNIKKLKYSYKNFYKYKAVFSIYETDELYYIKRMGVEYKIFRPKDYGFDFYGDILFTSKKFLKDDLKTVNSFIGATKRGWRYAFSHIDETIKVILQKYNTNHLTYDKLKDEAVRLKKYMSKNFTFDMQRVKNIADIYILLGSGNKKEKITDFIYNPLSLTQEEKRAIETKSLKCMSVDNWPPFVLKQDGKLVGIAIDYLHKIIKNTHIKYSCQTTHKWQNVLKSIKEKRADFTLCTDKTKDREKFAIFTKPYMKFPIVIVSKNEQSFVPDLSYLKFKKIAIAKDYTAEKIIKKHYPHLDIIETKNTLQALKLVKNGKADVAIDILPTMAYLINRDFPTSLKIVGKTPYIFNVRFMFSKTKENSLFVDIFNKTIDTIPESEKINIYNRWVSVIMENGYSLKDLIIYIVLGLFIILVILTWAIILKTEILKRKKLEKELEMIATKDQLTKIYNRYKMNSSFKELLELARRYDKKFGIIFFDVDHFKNINDTFGHDVGDEVLVELSKLVENIIRKSDLFGRWGGEEFLIILPEIKDEKEPLLLAEKLKEAISNHKFKSIEKLTCSFGVTVYQKNDDMASILKRVDQYLYKAKYLGRNRIVSDIN